MTSFMDNLSNAFTAKGRAVEIPHTAITEEVSTSIMAKNPGKVPVVVVRQDDRIQLKKSKFEKIDLLKTFKSFEIGFKIIIGLSPLTTNLSIFSSVKDHVIASK